MQTRVVVTMTVIIFVIFLGISTMCFFQGANSDNISLQDSKIIEQIPQLTTPLKGFREKEIMASSLIQKIEEGSKNKQMELSVNGNNTTILDVDPKETLHEAFTPAIRRPDITTSRVIAAASAMHGQPSPEESESQQQAPFSPDRESRSYLTGLLLTMLPYCPKVKKFQLEKIEKTSVKNPGVNSTPMLRSGQYGICLDGDNSPKLIECSLKAKNSKCQSENEFLIHLSEDSKPQTTLSWFFRARSHVSDQTYSVQETEPSSCQPQICSQLQRVPINTRNPVDCKSFYVCAVGHNFLVNCPPGEVFDVKRRHCVPAAVSNCVLDSRCIHKQE